MTDRPSGGNSFHKDQIDRNYFYQRFGEKLYLDGHERKIYAQLPEFHRNLLELAIKNKSFRSITLKVLHRGLGILADGLYRHYRKHSIPEGCTLSKMGTLGRPFNWSHFGLDTHEIEPCMELEAITELLYPVYGFEQLEERFISVISDLAAVGIIKALEDGDSTKVFLADIEAISDKYLSRQEQQCLKVWRAYLEPMQTEINSQNDTQQNLDDWLERLNESTGRNTDLSGSLNMPVKMRKPRSRPVKKDLEWEELVQQLHKKNSKLSHSDISKSLSSRLGVPAETIRRKTTNPNPRSKK